MATPVAPVPAAAAAPATGATAPFTSGSLYVGDLHPDATEAQLFEIFREIGPVSSIRVCRDAITRRSLGYAYVNFHSYTDAERALDLLNHREIKGRPFRIMWSQRDPALRRSNTGNVFIKNLDKEIDDKALHDTFSAFGNILSCKVGRDEKGNSKGFGFIHFDAQASADEAIAKVNGMLLKDQQVFVGPFVPRKIRSDAESANKWTNVYVKNIDKSVDETQFKALFEPFGTITSAALSKDEAGESRGFGFVNFELHSSAQAAVEALNGKDIAGKQLYVSRAQKKSERERELRDRYEKLRSERLSKYQGVNLFVKNLDDTVDDARLRQEFSACGSVTSAVVMKSDKGVSKGFGFVCFTTPEEATKAVTEMNGKMLGTKPIYVALAQRKEQRKAQLEAHYANRAQALRMHQAGIPIPFPGPGPMFFNPNARAPFPQPFQAGAVPRARFPGQPASPRPGFAPQGGFPQYPPGFVVGPLGPMQQPGQRPVPKNAQRGQPKAAPPGARPAPVPGAAGPVPPIAVPQAGAAPGYVGIKYNANVRNFQQAPQQAVPVPSSDGTPAAQPDRKQILGENLYPLILNVLRASNQDDLTGKVTGMFLESLEYEDLVQLLGAPEALSGKVNEALQILSKHNMEGRKE